MTANPFHFGSIVENEDFCPRVRLEKRLISQMKSGQNVAVIGPRRVGKSSLIHRSAAAFSKSTLVYADLWGVQTMADFIRRCVQAMDAIPDKANLVEKVVRAIPGLTISMTIDPLTGAPSLSPVLSRRTESTPESVAQIARLWASLHEEGHRIIVALDEFQDLISMEHADQVLGLLRREIQVLGKLPFCFCGSIRNEMWRIFGEDRGPLYKSATIIEVSAEDFDDWIGFLREKFEASRLKIDDMILARVIELADGNPGDTQQLCSSIWEVAKARKLKRITNEEVQQAVVQVFADERKGYEQIVSDVSSQQLAVLRAIAQLGGESVQSGEFLTLSGITHASSAKAAATRLVSRRILQESPTGLKFSNPFFKAWLLHVRY